MMMMMTGLIKCNIISDKSKPNEMTMFLDAGI